MNLLATPRTALTWKKGLLIFAASWLLTLFTAALLRQALIPKEELDCYGRVAALQKAVSRWNLAHPEKTMTEGIDEEALARDGLWEAEGYDRNRHYYFIEEAPGGRRVKCNKDEDNPLLLRLTGVTLLAVLVFSGFCYSRGLVLFGGE